MRIIQLVVFILSGQVLPNPGVYNWGQWILPLGTVLIGLTVPETKGKTAEQIQRHFKTRQAQTDIETEIKYLEDDSQMEASSSFLSSEKHSLS